MSISRETSKRKSFQFSLLTLLTLLSLAAILVAAHLALRTSSRFHSLSSPHMLLTVLPIVGCVALHAKRLVRPQRVAALSVGFYAVSMALPALRLAEGMILGYGALLCSFLGVGMEGQPAFFISCVLGCAANVGFLLAYVAFLIWSVSGKGLVATRWIASISTALTLVVILPLSFTGALNGLYLGYGVWAASILALTLGSWGIPCSAADDESGM